MSARLKTLLDKADRLMEEASEALVATRYFDCERKASEALALVHQSHDYDRMGRIVLPLQEARRLRRQLACDVKKVVRVDSYPELEGLMTGAKPIKPGCYLLEPPLVGADGRELREKALSADIPVLVIVREPQSRLGLIPIVAVGPFTIRTKVDPPKKVDVAWIQSAAEALGDDALSLVDPEECAADRVDHIIDLLAAFPDHEKLHQALAAACTEAHHDVLTAPPKRTRSAAADEKEADELDAEDEDPF